MVAKLLAHKVRKVRTWLIDELAMQPSWTRYII